MLEAAGLNEALHYLGALLHARGLRYDIAVVGGGALMLAGYLQRPTNDLDAIRLLDQRGWRRATPLPEPLREAVAQVGGALDLDSDWLNARADLVLLDALPDGFESRLERMDHGGVGVWIPHRADLVKLKLLAAADVWPGRNRHLSDLGLLGPGRTELADAARWCEQREGWQIVDALRGVLAELGASAGADADG